MPLTLTAAADDDRRRLDRILRKALPALPLSAIHRLLRQGFVHVDGKKADAGYRVQCGQTISIADTNDNEILLSNNLRGSSAPSRVCGMNLDIIFEGVGLLILNKPAGIAVHGKNSLEDLALSYLAPKLPTSLSFRPGPLHRLDKPSSGIIVFSASLEGARFFSALLRKRKLTKQYLAIVEGVIEKDEIWNDELARDHEKKKTFAAETEKEFVRSIGQTSQTKTALTKASPIASNANCTLILAEIETGRTHQIRAQAAAHGHPLLGDRKYGGKALGGSENNSDFGFLLHAWRMEFPADTPLPRLIEAPLPERFKMKIRELFKIDINKL